MPFLAKSKNDEVSFLGVTIALTQKGKHSSFPFGSRFLVHRLESQSHLNHLLPYGIAKGQNETLQRKLKRNHCLQALMFLYDLCCECPD